MSTTYHNLDNSDNNSPFNPDNVGYPQVDFKEKYADKWHEMQHWYGKNADFYFMQWITYHADELKNTRQEYVASLNRLDN